MSKNLLELKNKHLGKDIWIISAGSSMDYISKDFFNEKICITVNDMVKHFDCSYVVMKDCHKPKFSEAIKYSLEKNIPLIYSKYHEGKSRSRLNNPTHSNSYFFDHNPKINHFHEEILNLKEDEIIVSRSTITSAMHVAAYMGAKNIILCGHDCGTIDGDLYYSKYRPGNKHPLEYWPDGLKNAISKYEGQSMLTRQLLKERYNCNIVSLNPFISFNLEGYEFKALK